MTYCLDGTNQRQLEALRLSNPFVDQVLKQLDRILSSPVFEHVHQQTRDFLRFVVAKWLLNQKDDIKEAVIAVHVFGEPADFNTGESSRIRVAARQLRKRVASYNDDEGRRDPIRIALPSKGYVPDIHDRHTHVVLALDNWNPNGAKDHLCDGLGYEIIDRLNQAGWIHAIKAGASGSTTVPPRFAIRVSLEASANALRVNLSLGEIATGRILCSHYFEDELEHVFGVARHIADVLIRTFEMEVGGHSKPVRLPVRTAHATLRSRKSTRRIS